MKKNTLLLIAILNSLFVLSQNKIKTPKLRIDAGITASCIGYIDLRLQRNSIDFHYINLLPKTTFNLRLNRKNEFYFNYSGASYKFSLKDYETPYDQQSVSNFPSSLPVQMRIFGFGIKHFFKTNVSPIGRYFGVGFTVVKSTAPGFNYNYQDYMGFNYTYHHSSTDFTFPALTLSHGKRTMLTKKIYFNREFSYSFSPYRFTRDAFAYDITDLCVAKSLSLTSFNYLFALGVML